MKTADFEEEWAAATDMDTSPGYPVKVLDADGFKHEVATIVFDPEDQCFYIRTIWSYE